ncbi:S-layer homology domain-containing protein [Peptoniphilus sp. MSJ-1]|uniref:S-layer homology domain-containing protein n=1 Tax=Peptoniphilus ovalis TaxID=2841503 RepID=A0ABS6FF69_9FIRM|nr:S-layer homology domain-containing protein [Peptoniphilus ovalis]MBU5668688.1 S-layer homology domain-containing protein [Peptoniphilus ovalis]
MQTYTDGHLTDDKSAQNWEDYLKFSNESVSGNGSIEFAGIAKDKGADFVTVKDAPINSETFSEGYTIEILYYLPKDWTNNDKWMGILARQVADTANVKTMDEPELGSTSVAVSNCKEIQYLTVNENDSHEMTSSVWSVAMDKGGQWYHIAITCDDKGNINSFLNGAESFRNFNSSDDGAMKGMFADPEDGRFRVGSSWWKEGSQTLDKFLNGNIETIRISRGELDKSDWLIPNPESLAGDFGTNEEFHLENINNYNFVFIPDTQNTIKFKPDVMDTAINGLINDAQKGNIKAVSHLGDVVENYDSKEQFENSKNTFYKLADSNFQALMIPGNHDYAPEPGFGYNNIEFYSNPNNKPIDLYYKDYYGAGSEFLKKTPYTTADSPSGRSSYMKVRAGSYEYLMIGLSWYDLGRDMEWFENVLKENPENPTIIVAHNIVDCSDTEPSSVELSGVGEYIWPVIKKYDQVFMTVSGHYHGAGNKVYTNDNGNPVITILADYQFSYNGGNGFFKYAEFDESQNKIFLKTYSPYSASLPMNEKTFFDVNYMKGEGNDDILDLNFNERFDFAKKYQPIAKIEDIAKPIVVDEPSKPVVDENWDDYLVNNDNDVKTYPVFVSTDRTSIPKTENVVTENKTEEKVDSTKDYANHWAEEYIQKVLDKNLMDLQDGKFNPNKQSTRIELVKALARIQGVNPKDYNEKIFEDVEAGTEDGGYIAWANKNKFIFGYEDGEFKKDREITREEVAAILNRYVENLNVDRKEFKDIEFKDADEISDWAKDEVKKAVNRGLFEGRDDGTFDGKANITRAEIAKIVVNLLS